LSIANTINGSKINLVSEIRLGILVISRQFGVSSWATCQS